MEKSKRIIRAIMIGVVMTAIVMGLVYYYYDSGDKSISGKGTLVAIPGLGWYESWE